MKKNEKLISDKIEILLKPKKQEFQPPSITTLILIIFTILSIITVIILLFVFSNQNKEYALFKEATNEYRDKIEKISTNTKELEEQISSQSNEITELRIKSENFYQKSMELYKKYYKELNHNQCLKNRESYFNIPKISVIIKTVSELEQILTFVKNSLKIEDDYYPSVVQLYKARRDGDHHSTFIPKIEGKSDLIILIKILGDIKFGGYIHIPVKRSPESNIDNNSFLFSLNLNKSFPIKENHEAFWYNELMVFSFGKSDIFISDGFLSNSFSLDYFPRNFGDSHDKSQKAILTQGHVGFKIDELEVYQLINTDKVMKEINNDN